MSSENLEPLSFINQLRRMLEYVMKPIEEKGGTFYNLVSFLDKPINRIYLANLILGKLERPKTTTYSVTTDYSMTLKEMKAVLKYEWEYCEYLEVNLPRDKEGVVNIDFEFLQFNIGVDKKDVQAYIEVHGLRSATIAELLAFGAQYPEMLCKEYNILALGSSWRPWGMDYECVPSISLMSISGSNIRALVSQHDKGNLGSKCIFLVTPK